MAPEAPRVRYIRHLKTVRNSRILRRRRRTLTCRLRPAPGPGPWTRTTRRRSYRWRTVDNVCGRLTNAAMTTRRLPRAYWRAFRWNRRVCVIGNRQRVYRPLSVRWPAIKTVDQKRIEKRSYANSTICYYDTRIDVTRHNGGFANLWAQNNTAPTAVTRYGLDARIGPTTFHIGPPPVSVLQIIRTRFKLSVFE